MTLVHFDRCHFNKSIIGCFANSWPTGASTGLNDDTFFLFVCVCVLFCLIFLIEYMTPDIYVHKEQAWPAVQTARRVLHMNIHELILSKTNWCTLAMHAMSTYREKEELTPRVSCRIISAMWCRAQCNWLSTILRVGVCNPVPLPPTTNIGMGHY